MMFKKEGKVRSHKFHVRDFVRVRSKEEISENLDPMNKLNGCLFMNQMWEFCGKEFKIVKVVKNFFDEHQCKIYQVSAPLYILDGVICDGKIESFKHTCDHSCYLLWHEDWIMKTER